MKTNETAKEVIIIFIITFITGSAVTFLYSLLFHSKGIVNWATAFSLAVTFAVVFPLINRRERKKS